MTVQLAKPRIPLWIPVLALVGCAGVAVAGMNPEAPWRLALHPETLHLPPPLPGSPALRLITSLAPALRNLGLMAIGLALLAALVAWLRPRLLPTTSVFVLAALAYGFSGGLFLGRQSDAPHYVFLADAFVHGRFDLADEPPCPEECDWTYYQGHWTVAFPPMPAILMLPFVAWAGTGFNDVAFTVLLGALNIALVYDLLPSLGRSVSPGFETSPRVRLALILLFGFGTVHWWVASVGQVWFTAQIVAVTFLLLALREAFARGRPILVAAWLALSALARPPVLLALPVFLWLLSPANPPRRLALGAIPLALAGAFMAWYDWARFGNPFELGYRYMQIEHLLEVTLQEHGPFSLAYLGQNLHYAFLDVPRLSARWPFVIMDGWGLSIFISSPALLLLFAAPWRQKTAQASGLAAGLVAVPSLLYYNSGYLQAGYRYALDFLPFLVILVALAARGRLTRLAATLVILSLLMGFLSLVNFNMMYFEWL